MVEFPRGIVQGEMPPIFVIGPDGEAEITNSRVYQNVLIVDRLFGAAELRLGAGKRQQRVRIVRTDRGRTAGLWRRLDDSAAAKLPNSMQKGALQP
ncbi:MULTISPECIES: TrbG/VirB9 family P-type conjugative transfer protein [unclassified Mesorhizobium]|uniref:TrbG/VirB9 family P-type conjugative transfer protein n=1 Tax=Mesorhizobium sp. B2-4-4 TaxID=2589945 RepID=UPI00296239D9|nr:MULTISPECIES: TrbG/VirB9 family P-type conjugative transfer protein [unclassified Mesorhizobium]